MIYKMRQVTSESSTARIRRGDIVQRLCPDAAWEGEPRCGTVHLLKITGSLPQTRSIIQVKTLCGLPSITGCPVGSSLSYNSPGSCPLLMPSKSLSLDDDKSVRHAIR